MTQTQARIKKDGKNFEILVDLDEALKVKKGEGNIGSAIEQDVIFYNLKSGDRASSEDLEKSFGTSDFNSVAEKIIKQGEIVLPTDFVKKEQNQKYKQVVDFLVKNAVDQNSRPYTPDRMMKALEEAHVKIDNKEIESQIQDIVEQLKKVIPIKLDIKNIKITVPSQHTGKAYGVLHNYIKKEEWLSNGDLEAIVALPAGIVMDFYDKLNSVTHGSALAEEIKVQI